MQLVIVESPYKKNTLQQYLEKEWRVEACMGHICDLPLDRLGVVEPHFQPEYELLPQSELIIKKLKRLALQAECLWLATDPDREGEAMAWHLARYLEAKSVKRLYLYEITKRAIQEVIANPSTLDERLVKAQQARRVVDKLIGYQVSSTLSKVLLQPVSAGRVQSIAIKLIVEQERAIRQFRSSEYFGVRLSLVNNVPWFADWDTEPFVNPTIPYVFDKALAQKISKVDLVRVTAIEHQEVQKKPPPPFITTTLQKAAYFVLGFPVEQTMSLAQSLFENGAISYHRTDNPNFLEGTIENAHCTLKQMGYGAHLPTVPNHWEGIKHGQEAHEAIRPTDFSCQSISSLDEKEKALYQLIWLRALASQLFPALVQCSTITLQAASPIPGIKEGLVTFKWHGQSLLYPGWQLLLERDEAEETEANNYAILPNVKEGDCLVPKSGMLLTIKTRAPKRYSEPALISKLEKEGIGRPSTYGLILKAIQRRKYVTQKNQLFYAEPLAEKIICAMEGKCQFLEFSYTEVLEKALNGIAKGTESYEPIVSRINEALQKDLVLLQKAPGTCPSCQGPLKRIRGPEGYFFKCSRYPEGCAINLKVDAEPFKSAPNIKEES